MESRQASLLKFTDSNRQEQQEEPAPSYKNEEDYLAENIQQKRNDHDNQSEQYSNSTFRSEDDADQTFDNARYDEEKTMEELLSSEDLPPPFRSKWHAMEQFLYDFPHLEEFAPSFMDNDSGQFYRLKSRHVPIYLFHWFPSSSCNTWIRCHFSSHGQPDWQHIQDVDILNNLHRQK